MRNGCRVVVAAFLFALGGTADAQSQFHDIYLGVGAGPSKAKDPAQCDPIAGFVTTSCDIEDKKTGFKVFLGYQVNPYLGIEAEYADLGKFKTSAVYTAVVPPPLNISSTFRVTLAGVDLVGTLPFGGGFGLLGRIGLVRWTLVESTEAPFVPGISAPGGETVRGNSFDVGVGAKWDFTKNLGARVEYQRYRRVGGGDLGESDVDLLSASLLYRFQ